MEIIEIIHTNPSLTTLREIAEDLLISFDEGFGLQEWFEYGDNKKNIKLLYRESDGAEARIDLIRVGTLLQVPVENFSKMSEEIAAIATNTVVPNSNFKAFIEQNVSRLINNESYQKLILNDEGFDSTNNIGNFYKISTKFNVWIACRALGWKVFNVTPFVQNLVISSTETGGNFSVKLAPITCVYDEEKGWIIDESLLDKFTFNGQKNFFFKDTLLSKVKATHNNEFVFKRKNFLFSTVLSANDLVFIQGERLKVEDDAQEANDLLASPDFIFRTIIGNRRENSDLVSDSFYEKLMSLPMRLWDMIGLIDVPAQSYQAASSEVSIDVNGRDLMKLLIEDGTYFFPLDFASSKGGFVNYEKGQTAMKRLVNGELSFFNAFVDRSIEYTVKFIFNQLSNIEICPDNIFKFWPEGSKSTRFELIDTEAEESSIPNVNSTYNDNNKVFKKVFAKGIWQIIKVVIDEEIAPRRIVDSSIASDSGSLLNFFNKVCQKPFVEFYGETFGNQYFFIIRKPPTSQKSYISNYVLDIESDQVITDNLIMDDSEAYSWYRLIPKGNFFGDSESISLAYFPAIYFEEYAKIWGSKPLEIISNYINFYGIKDKDFTVNEDELEIQAMQDLAYIIESNAYMPFTRKGSITINKDRRVRRGINIRNKLTGELFHVDSFTHSESVGMNQIESTTTINVSRGMVERYANPKYSPHFNYFNIIDLRKDINGVTKDNNFTVRRDVLEFFLNRRQFS